MKKALLCTITLVFFAAMLPAALSARTIEPTVSTDWLAKNTDNPKVVVVDIRKVEDYKAGHIPKAVSIFYNTWAITAGGLRNQVPPVDDLADIINSAGIASDSQVIVVGTASNLPDRASTSRVAWSLKYAGLEDVAVLDGGHEKWAAEKKPLSTEAVKPKPGTFQPKLNNNLPALKDYVLAAIGKETIVDAREPEFFEGKKKLDFVDRAGRIKGAVNLPSSLAYNKDGTFKSKAELADAAGKVVGADTGKKIIVYCDTGRLATVWAWVLADMLGYKNVRMYDGSSEEWMKDPKAPIEP